MDSKLQERVKGCLIIILFYFSESRRSLQCTSFSLQLVKEFFNNFICMLYHLSGCHLKLFIQCLNASSHCMEHYYCL